MTEKELKIRTKKFAEDVLLYIDGLPRTRSGNIIATQLGKCASSVGANYRAACRGRSLAEFIAKIGIVEEEADESTFWFDIIPATQKIKVESIEPFLREARELTAIFTATSKTAKKRLRNAGADSKSNH
jgi:four helix bundle protein